MVNNLIKNSQKLLANKQNTILSAATVITFASLLSAILGFVRERILITYFFHQYRDQLDAFRIASRLPELAFQFLVIGALSAAFIPVFSKYLNKDEDEAYHPSHVGGYPAGSCQVAAAPPYQRSQDAPAIERKARN